MSSFLMNVSSPLADVMGVVTFVVVWSMLVRPEFYGDQRGTGVSYTVCHVILYQIKSIHVVLLRAFGDATV